MPLLQYTDQLQFTLQRKNMLVRNHETKLQL